MTEPLPPLDIRSGQGDYPVDFFAGAAEVIEAASHIQDAFFLVDRNVAALYEKPLATLSGKPVLLADATEDEKTLDGVGRVVRFLQDNQCKKGGILVAIGGGIIQDLATFSSHIYYRGIRWAFVPTTLLAMSDSSIGAKCGINLGAYKNQLGVFQSPSRVMISTAFLDTLSDADVLSGYGEILKLLLTGPADGFARLREVMDRDGLRNEQLPALIHESLAVKKAVIEEDEYERDRRRILNYGHTFGHALEALTNHAIPHGTAVAWGLDAVNYIAASRGILSRGTFEEISSFVRRHFEVRLPRPVSARELIAAAGRDKKAAAGSVSLILLAAPGDLRIVSTPLDAVLEAQLTEFLAYRDANRHP